MMDRLAPADEFEDWHFPKAGIDLSKAFSKQTPRPMPYNGQYARTCAVGVNVRAFEPGTQRNRGGARAGLTKWHPEPVIDLYIVQMIDIMVIDDVSVVV